MQVFSSMTLIWKLFSLHTTKDIFKDKMGNNAYLLDVYCWT